MDERGKIEIVHVKEKASRDQRAGEEINEREKEIIKRGTSGLRTELQRPVSTLPQCRLLAMFVLFSTVDYFR